ncbi:phage baseplate assembly protein domain-containing protein [Massilia eburnea]|uniref:phage baseplate assembly protein domain-containing protein n=1 Tax=Massilia eburnea TaxID=1776165 RepID=UPI003D6A86D0
MTTSNASRNTGFTSVPKPGAEGVVVFVGGNRDHGLVIAVEDRRFRLKGLASGEVAIYDDQGQKVHLTRAAYRDRWRWKGCDDPECSGRARSARPGCRARHHRAARRHRPRQQVHGRHAADL